MAAAARQDAAGRSRTGAPHSRRRDQGVAGEEPSLSRVARPHPDRAGRITGCADQGHALEPAAARPAAGVRLHPGRHQHPDDADGVDRRGSQRLDGQRYADLGAVGQAEATVHLLQAELRAGDQSADRSDPRRTCHEPGLDHRTAAEPVRSAGHGRHQASRSAPADPDRHRSGKDPVDFGNRGHPFQVAHARHDLPCRLRSGGT